ncbi:MAG: DegT/DnrJ/EryC1/StrS family aminotransferase [Lentisphaeraceae bacterium]|nr:DegT/DnrJ/EryC1/StrS family aminotransferase [Lentisphaeraceae bacterium]
MSVLAIEGGSPVLSDSWPSWPYFDEEMVQVTSEILRSGKVNYWTGDIYTLEDGTKVRGENGLFEYEFAKYHSVPYAIALGNGTLALELALYSFGVGVGDEVITTSRTFIASASAAVMRGAKPIFADIDEASQNLCFETIKALVTPATKAVIAVHLAGWACEMDELQLFLDDKEKEFGHKIYLIEDCAQCLGGEYKGKKLGSIGDAGCFSFCQDKIITTGGEGGMLVLKDPDVYRKAWSFKDHGKDFDKYNKVLAHPLVDEEISREPSFYSSIGTNWRMTEIQAAIGRVALSKLDSWNIKRRRQYAQMLNEGLQGIEGIKLTIPPEYIFHSYYKYYCFLDLDKMKPKWTRDRVIEAISAEGVVCQYGSTWGIASEQAWSNVDVITGECWDLRKLSHFKNDEKLGSSALMFQVHPTLEIVHIEATVKAVRKVMQDVIKG